MDVTWWRALTPLIEAFSENLRGLQLLHPGVLNHVASLMLVLMLFRAGSQHPPLHCMPSPVAEATGRPPTGPIRGPSKHTACLQHVKTLALGHTLCRHMVTFFALPKLPLKAVLQLRRP